MHSHTHSGMHRVHNSTSWSSAKVFIHMIRLHHMHICYAKYPMQQQQQQQNNSLDTLHMWGWAWLYVGHTKGRYLAIVARMLRCTPKRRGIEVAVFVVVDAGILCLCWCWCSRCRIQSSRSSYKIWYAICCCTAKFFIRFSFRNFYLCYAFGILEYMGNVYFWI